MAQGRIEKMSENVPDLTPETLTQTNGVVAQMGMEPVLDALDRAQIIICGRAYDPAPFAAVGVKRGHDAGLAYHLGKILECGALCCEPGTTKDCMLGVLEDDGFVVYPAAPSRRCTSVSVAAHTFYEKDHPYLLHGPGMLLDLSACTFTELDGGRVRVTGSRLIPQPYTLKLEGARPRWRTVPLCWRASATRCSSPGWRKWNARWCAACTPTMRTYLLKAIKFTFIITASMR